MHRATSYPWPGTLRRRPAKHHGILDGPGWLLRLVQWQDSPRTTLRAVTHVATRWVCRGHRDLLIGPGVATVPVGRLAERQRARPLCSASDEFGRNVPTNRVTV